MISPKPLLTIAIPTVNRLDLLKQALASALSQTATVDIIVSDNGSTDGTREYLASVPSAENLRLFRHEKTMSVQQHGSFLVSQLRTEWVVFLSDDDFLEPDFAKAVAGLAREIPDVALIYTGCDMTFGSVAVPARVGPKLEPASTFFYEFMKGHRNICMCATAFRVSDRCRIGAQPESHAIGDMYYWTRILAAGGVIGCIGRHLSNYSFYRQGTSTETNRTSVQAWVRESRELAGTMSQSIVDLDSSQYNARQIGRVRRKFLALTTSNHFAWNALRGAKKLDLLVSFIGLVPVICGNMWALPRAVASIILPRSVLEWRLLSHARRLAAAARTP